jgi:Fic family protein
LKLPNLRFYLGELCTKTIWGMDNRDNMLAIRAAQKAVAEADPLVDYVPTNHDAVEIGGEAGLHYHYGTLGQLEHGVNHADAYLRTLGIVFETASPFETPFAMKRLVEWMIEAERDGDLHPLLVTGVFVVWFLAIHPFQDGNGRLSRVLTTLLLLRHGYSYVPYASLESVIEENKEFYYKALRKTQATMRKKRVEWDAWLLFFLRCLVRQKDNLNVKVQVEQRRVEASSPLAASLMRLLDDAESITLAEAVKATAANRNTLKAKMSELVDAGLLTRHGRGRGVHYTKGKHEN